MDEHPTAPASAAEAPATTIPSTATMAQATAQATARSGGKKVTPSRLVEQVGALQQAETIKQLQGQVKALEAQSQAASRVFVATLTGLVTSAFALVAALAWNDAIQALLKTVVPLNQEGNGWGLVITTFIYALFITLIVVVVIFYLTKLNTRFGGKSLIGGGASEIKKE